MELDAVAAIATLLGALSVASERLVEIMKGFVPFLDAKNDNPVMEGRRRSVLHGLAIIAGIATAYIARFSMGGVLPDSLVVTEGGQEAVSLMGVVGLGVLASGGSGLWNSVLGYANKVKEIKRLQADESRRRLR